MANRLSFQLRSKLCITSESTGRATDFRWAQKAGGTDRDYGTGIAMDSMGNSYVIGKFASSNAVFGNFTLTNGGLFLAKY